MCENRISVGVIEYLTIMNGENVQLNSKPIGSLCPMNLPSARLCFLIFVDPSSTNLGATPNFCLENLVFYLYDKVVSKIYLTNFNLL